MTTEGTYVYKQAAITYLSSEDVKSGMATDRHTFKHETDDGD